MNLIRTLEFNNTMELNAFFAVSLGLFYGLNEIYISIKRYSSSSKASSKDGGTFTSLWIVIMSSISISIYMVRRGYGWKMIEDPSSRYFLLIPIGVSLFLLGHILRQQAIKQLGQWFTTAVRTDENQQLIDVGWYARMRHPSYTGSLTCFLGPSLLMNNWLSFIGIMLPICSVFFYRIHVEEKVLEKHFGMKYREYRKKVPNMILPKIF